MEEVALVHLAIAPNITPVSVMKKIFPVPKKVNETSPAIVLEWLQVQVVLLLVAHI